MSNCLRITSNMQPFKNPLQYNVKGFCKKKSNKKVFHLCSKGDLTLLFFLTKILLLILYL